MTFYEWFILVTGVVGGLTALYTFVKRTVQPIVDTMNKIDANTENINILMDHDKEQYLAILRLTITADHIPISERIIAGKKYIKLGGNGDIKAYYEQLLKEHTK